MTRGTYKKIGLATIIMMASIFLSRVTGLVREMVLAAVEGADTAVDAYRVAFILPEILNHILASGFLAVTFIPIFSGHLSNDREGEGWRIFSIIMTVFGLLLVVLILAAMLFAPVLVPIIAPGRNDPAFIELVVKMTRITLPAQLFFFLGGLLMAVQYAKERFLIPALAPLIYNLGIILGGIWLAPRMGIEGFCWGALAGAGAGSFIIQWFGARRANMQFMPIFDIRHPDLKRYILLTLPLMLGLTMMFSTELFSKAFGSFLPEGAISWMDYALRIMFLMVAFFGQAIGVASYPFMAKMAVQGRMNELHDIINRALITLSIVIPVSAWIWVLRREIVQLLYERGQFAAADTAMTALALSGLMLGAFAFSAQTVVNRGFYATQNTLLPAVFGSIAVVLSLPMYWFGIQRWGIAGLGIAISLSAIAQTILLFAIWNRRSRNVNAARVYREYAVSAAAAGIICPILWWFHRGVVLHYSTRTMAANLAIIAFVSAVFLALLAIWGWLFKVDAVVWFFRGIRTRIDRR